MWRQTHPDYMRKKRSTLKYKMNAWRRKANIRHIEFSISENDIQKLPMVCAYSGVPLTMEVGKDNSISLDRIDSSKGYIPDNIALCTSWVNRMKQEKSVAEFVEMCGRIFQHRST